VRCAKLGLDHGLKGALIAPSSYFKKSPPHQFPDDYCRTITESFIRDPRGTEQKIRAVVAERAAKRAAAGGGKSKRAAKAAPSRDGRKHAMARAAEATHSGTSANGNGSVSARVAARAATLTRRARKPARKRATARAR
jgi:hypothetical protein